MQSKNKYALKIVSKSTLVKPRAEQKLRSEIRIHRTLNHVNIVRFERYFEDSQNAYLLLELCINNSMSDLMKRRKKLVEFEARYYLTQIVQSLKYLHHHKVIHRDLKLGNLFIDHHMQVKVGDFGLATKLSHMDERKKTVCGTPNYIAPEILEGKNGHSFEVDIWSTGVILFTLLCGKPPFEAKDVKSTYKRIVANQYSFPDHTVVSCEAKDSIRHMLQPKPHNRPSLDQCIDHPFFSGAQAYCPTKLDTSCLKEAPVPPTKTLSGNSSSAFTSGPPHVNDENDPHAANRGAKPSEPLLDLRVGGTGPPKLGERTTSASSRGAAASKAVLSSSTRAPVSTNPGMSGDLMPRRSNSGSSSGCSSGGNSANIVGSYTQKFEIYQDSMGKKSSGSSLAAGQGISFASRDSFASGRASGATTREEITSGGYLSSLGSGKGFKSCNSLQTEGQEMTKASKSLVKSDAMDVVDSLNVNMEQVQISAGAVANTGVGGASATASAWAGPDVCTTATAKATAKITTTTSASSAVARASTPKGRHPSVNPSKPLDTLESMHKMLNRSLNGNEAVGVTGNGYMAAYAQASNNNLDSPDQRAEADASYVDDDNNGVSCRPGTASSSAGELASARASSARSSTATTHTETEDLQTIFAHGQPSVRSEEVNARDLASMTAKVWVVRYVDYTSKYGLGFLLNTGSAGVYFNDSTKIVLSADGMLFQYVERRRRENGHSSSEHTSQTHLMSAYPQELQRR